MNTDQFIIFFRKRIEPFIALAVLIVLVALTFQLIKGNELRNEISQNCGWEGEDYRCFCEKSESLEILNKINNDLQIEGIEYVQVGG